MKLWLQLKPWKRIWHERGGEGGEAGCQISALPDLVSEINLAKSGLKNGQQGGQVAASKGAQS